jgi:hypothetical protein
VGFRTPDEAEAALRYFNKSFMDTMRLAVEVGAAALAALCSAHCQFTFCAYSLFNRKGTCDTDPRNSGSARLLPVD